MKTINLFSLTRQLKPLRGSFNEIFNNVLDRNEFTYGEQTQILETNFANFVGSKYALAVKSGTAALLIAMKALEFQKGDEVITTPMTFSATADAIVLAGAKPVFVDIELKTGNIDPLNLEKARTKKTKAVLVVHFAGVPCEMDKIINFCKKYQLFLIEDAAHAHGSLYKNKRTGSFGDIACFSFYPSKAFGSLGNAGMITSSNKNLFKKIKMYAEHGLYGKKYEHNVIGFNERIDNFQAAFLNVKFPFLERWINKRLKIAKRYQAVFKEKNVPTVNWDKEIKPSLYVFSIFLKNRKKFAKYLFDNGVETGIYYPIPLHLQKSLVFLGYKKGDFPHAELYAKTTLSIPFYPELEDRELKYIYHLIRNYQF